MKPFFVLSIVFAAVAVYLAVTPTPRNINPVRWPYRKLPEPAPLEGGFTPNDALQKIATVGKGIPHPDGIIFSAEGDLYATSDDGWIWRVDGVTGKPKQWAFVGGRPMAGKFDANGDLIVTVVPTGLCKVDRKTKAVSILANYVEGRPILFAYDLDIASDGKIYFTDASELAPHMAGDGLYDTLYPFVLNYLEGSRTGRLLLYDTSTGKASSLFASRLLFATGVTLTEDESYVLVGSALTLEVFKLHLKGKHHAMVDKKPFLSSLPGVGRISRAPDGGYWIAVPFQYDELTLRLRHYPALRTIASRFAHLARYLLKDYGMVIHVSPDGNDIRSYHDPTGESVGAITSALEHDGHLYVGSSSKIGKLKL